MREINMACLEVTKNNMIGIFEDFVISVESENLEFLQKVINVCKAGEEQ